MMTYLAVDIGGTFIKYAVMDENCELIEKNKVETSKNENNGILYQVESIIREKLDGGTDLKGIGISTAGIVDRDIGEIIYAGPTIPNYKGTPFKAYLTQKFNIPVYVENDVNAALLGEVWRGAGRGRDNVFCITLGTGIGGAYYSGNLKSGAHRQANSVGYLLKNESTGLNYEQRASTSALKNRMIKKHGPAMTAEALFEKAKSGDEASISTIDDWAGDVAEGLAQIIILLDPGYIIIGGGISQQGEFLLNLIEKHIVSFLPPDFLKTELKIAERFNDASLYGAIHPFFENTDN